MKEKRYYIAYGSNLNVGQMRMRCPHATILGTANLKGWELLFKHPWKAEVSEDDSGVSPTVISGWYDEVYEPSYADQTSDTGGEG